MIRPSREVDQHHACRALGLGSLTENSARTDVDIGDRSLLAHERDMCDDVDGGDVSSKDAQTLLVLGGLLLADGLDHLLHATADLLVLGGLCHKLVDTLCQLVVSKRGGDGNEKGRLVSDIDCVGLLGGRRPFLGLGGLLAGSLRGLGFVTHFLNLIMCLCAVCVLI